MKVLHLTHTNIKKDSRILKEIRCLVKFSFDVYGIGVGRTDLTCENTRAGFNLKNINIKSREINWLPKVVKKLIIYIEMLIKVFITGKKFQPDIIHSHDIVGLTFGVMISLFEKTALIYDAHELESAKNGQTKFTSWLVLNLEKIFWKKISALIVVSPSIENWYRENLGPKYSEVILNSPIINQNETYSSNYLRNHFGISQKYKIFLYIGAFMTGRNLELIVEAFCEKGVVSHLVLLGSGEFDAKTLAKIQKNDRIHIHHSVPHEQVVEIARDANYGLCLIENISLSDYYSLPNKLFEYAFAGIPTLASNFPDMSNMVNAHSLGRVCDLTVSSIVNEIQKFESEDPEFQFQGLSELSWDNQEKKLLKIYRKKLI